MLGRSRGWPSITARDLCLVARHGRNVDTNLRRYPKPSASGVDQRFERQLSGFIAEFPGVVTSLRAHFPYTHPERYVESLRAPREAPSAPPAPEAPRFGV